MSDLSITSFQEAEAENDCWQKAYVSGICSRKVFNKIKSQLKGTRFIIVDSQEALDFPVYLTKVNSEVVEELGLRSMFTMNTYSCMPCIMEDKVSFTLYDPIEGLSEPPSLWDFLKSIGLSVPPRIQDRLEQVSEQTGQPA